METHLDLCDQREAVKIAEGLLAQEPESKFHKVVDDHGARCERCILICHDEEHVGFAVVADGGTDAPVKTMCEIYRFFIVPSKRREGIGSKAVKEVLSLLADECIQRVYLEVTSPENYRFWGKAVEPLELQRTSIYNDMYYLELRP